MLDYNLHNDCKVLSKRVYPENRQEDSNGWTYRETYSNPKSGYYSEVYTKDNTVVMVIRGTEVHSSGKEATKDVLNDSQIGLGYLPSQMKEVDKRTRIGELIYVEEYTRSDGTKVSGYYRANPKK